MTPSTHGPGSPRPTGQLLGIALIVVAAIGFGSGPFFARPLYEAGMTALPIVFWRFTVAALTSWAIVLLTGRGRRSLGRIGRRGLLVLFGLGVVYAGNSSTYVAALGELDTSLVTIITYLYPAIVAVLAARWARGPAGRRGWLALALSTVGVALAVGGVPAGSDPPVWGLAMAFAGAFIYAGWIILQARLTGERPARDVPDPGAGPVATAGGRRDPDDGPLPTAGVTIDPGGAPIAEPREAPDPAPATAVMTTGTALTVGLAALLTGGAVAPASVPSSAWPALVGFGLVSTALAVRAFYAGTARVGAARAAMLSTVEPVYTIAMATILLGETLAPVQLLGGILVIGGVVLAESGQLARSSEAAARDHEDEPARGTSATPGAARSGD